MKKINSSYIALVPKGQDPTNLFNFGPISLYNMVCEIFSKAFVNRIKTLPRKLINVNKKGFVLNYQILDVVIVDT